MEFFNPLKPTQPDPFPNPVIRGSKFRRVNVLISGQLERKAVIESGSGNYYEIGAPLKKAIFGQVVLAVLLAPAEGDCFVRTESQRAIKIYSKRTLRALQGRTAENPLVEITALQFIGDTHPNIMGQIECCTDEDNIYSVMRFCPGGELFDFIDLHGPMGDSRARSMFRQLMCGMSHLASLGIAHRDMSLENMLYDDAGELFVIIDFGMCLRCQKEDPKSGLGPLDANLGQKGQFDPNSGQMELEDPDSGQRQGQGQGGGAQTRFHPMFKQTVCGKRNYISPEVLREDPVFNPMLADVWAAGVILFIALTGVPPVDTATVADERFQMIRDNKLAEMLHSWNLHIDPRAVDLMQRILRPEPAARLTLRQIQEHPWMS